MQEGRRRRKKRKDDLRRMRIDLMEHAREAKSSSSLRRPPMSANEKQRILDNMKRKIEIEGTQLMKEGARVTGVRQTAYGLISKH